MKTFYCPYCNEKLSFLNGSLIKLLGHLSSSKFNASTYFYIPGTIGSYDVMVEGRFELKDGLKVDFCCINNKCEKSFTTDYDNDLAEIKMIDDDGREYVVVFNRIYGKHSTFVVDYKHKAIAGSYGEDKATYIHDFDKDINFFGE
ncbi:hypothetical protein JW960_13035 [candidate division KSB1 bacterium]|nr:hypothetical protein [candidate division KSB1 bacterium]